MLLKMVSATNNTTSSVEVGEQMPSTPIASINTPTVEILHLTVVETPTCLATAVLLAWFLMQLQLASTKTTLTALDMD
jgi:nitrous oxidase accessory protein NosD